MGENIEVKKVEIENNGTLLQVDTDKGRIFVNMRDIYKAMNNFAYLNHDEALKANGFELKDPENYRNPNLID